MRVSRGWVRLLGICVLGVMAGSALAGCVSGPVGGTAGSASRLPAGGGVSAASGDVSLTFADSGRSVVVHVGTRVHVALGSAYWSYQPDRAPRVLRLDATGFVRPSSPCMAGVGCGTRTADYTAIAVGRAVIVATRTSCGEAMRCVGKNGYFEVDLDVKD